MALSLPITEYVDFLQVGAHVGKTGNDPLFHNELKNRTLILVEPVPYLFQQLKTNYAERTQDNTIVTLNMAVSNYDGHLRLYVPSPTNNFSQFPFWASQLASTHKDHIPTHLPGLQVDTLDVPCARLNTLIKTMDIQHIEYLMVDTEGHDYDILMDFDLTRIKPTKIKFENKHMDGIFTRSHKYAALLRHFSAHGYTVVFEDQEDTIVSLLW